MPLNGTCGCAFLLPINLKPVLSQTGKASSNYSRALHLWHLLSIGPPSSLDECLQVPPHPFCIPGSWNQHQNTSAEHTADL